MIGLVAYCLTFLIGINGLILLAMIRRHKQIQRATVALWKMYRSRR